jgi:hypothetical protein
MLNDKPLVYPFGKLQIGGLVALSDRADRPVLDAMRDPGVAYRIPSRSISGLRLRKPQLAEVEII